MPSPNTRLYSLDHCTYICQYHLVWVTRYRGKVLADTYIKQELKRIFKQLAQWKGIIILQWHIGDEHVHLYVIIPPKYSLSYAIQIMKGKSSGWIKKKTKKLQKGALWARGYFVSTVGINEHQIRTYIQNQNHRRPELSQLPLRRR